MIRIALVIVTWTVFVLACAAYHEHRRNVQLLPVRAMIGEQEQYLLLPVPRQHPLDNEFEAVRAFEGAMLGARFCPNWPPPFSGKNNFGELAWLPGHCP